MSASSPSSSPSSPAVEPEWAEYVEQERTWFAVQMGALAFLLLAVVSWPRTTSNVALEAVLCLLVGVAASRHSRAGRARARLTPVLRAEPVSEPPSAPVRPLAKAPRA